MDNTNRNALAAAVLAGAVGGAAKNAGAQSLPVCDCFPNSNTVTLGEAAFKFLGQATVGWDAPIPSDTMYSMNKVASGAEFDYIADGNTVTAQLCRRTLISTSCTAAVSRVASNNSAVQLALNTTGISGVSASANYFMHVSNGIQRIVGGTVSVKSW